MGDSRACTSSGGESLHLFRGCVVCRLLISAENGGCLGSAAAVYPKGCLRARVGLGQALREQQAGGPGLR